MARALTLYDVTLKEVLDVESKVATESLPSTTVAVNCCEMPVTTVRNSATRRECCGYLACLVILSQLLVD